MQVERGVQRERERERRLQLPTKRRQRQQRRKNLKKQRVQSFCRNYCEPFVICAVCQASVTVSPFFFWSGLSRSSLNPKVLELNYFSSFFLQSTVRNEQKELNLTPVHHLNVSYATATFGMGCFWGAESLYGATRGVLRTTVGYAGGSSELPTYRKM